MPSRLHLLVFALLLFGFHEVQLSSTRPGGRAGLTSEASLQSDTGTPCSLCGLLGRRVDLPAVAGATLPHPDAAFATLVAVARETSERSFALPRPLR